MRVWSQNGVFCHPGENIVVDPVRKKIDAVRAFVSHAHSDHVFVGARNACEYVMTKPTRALVERKIPSSAKVKTLSYGKKLKSDSYTVSFANAGHIIGSSQVVIENDSKLCVTTDFKLQDSIIQKGADIVPCDVLVIEGTFGLKQFSFQDREKTYEEMGKWIADSIKNNYLPVLAGYAVGKAQELTKVVNEYSDVTPFVHDSVFDKNKIHELFGTSLGEYARIDHNLKDSELLILPPSLCSPHVLQAISVSAGKKILAAKATGWNWQESYSKLFPLSDHGDYNQLLRYVKESNPKMVFTHNGFAGELSRSITMETGIPSIPLKDASQKVLAQYAEVSKG